MSLFSWFRTTIPIDHKDTTTMQLLPLLIACILSSSLVSCVTGQGSAIDQQSASKLKGKTLSLTNRSPEPLRITTVGDVMGGLALGMAAGAALGPTTGAAVAGANAAAGPATSAQPPLDPAIEVSEKLAAELRQQRGMKVAALAPVQVRSASPEKLAHAAGGADYVLDVRTTFWMSSYYPMHPRHYWIACRIEMKLIEVATGKAVASGVYHQRPDYTEDAPKFDELTKDGAPGLKRLIQQHAVAALREFRPLLF